MFRWSVNRAWRRVGLVGVVVVVTSLIAAAAAAAASAAGPAVLTPPPTYLTPAAFDKSKPLSELVGTGTAIERGPHAGNAPVVSADAGFSGDAAVQSDPVAPAIPGTLANFEGLSNQDNFNIFGFRVNPPDPVGDVGPNHYVEMINLVFGVFSKTGTKLLGPVDTGTLWAGFPIEDCIDPSGDPIVVYDQFVDRWILTQFTTRGFDDQGNFNGLPFYNCIAISATGDPTGAYFRYAYITDLPGSDSAFFPDYPKYGVWKDSYLMTSRDFGSNGEYGISVYGLEKNKMVAGDPNARAVHFFLDSAFIPLALIGDGLLPPDVDGNKPPPPQAKAPIVGTQDDGAGYGATFDALNIWDFDVKWKATPSASIELAEQLPTASFDSIFPCVGPPGSRDCLPQPGITNPTQFLDILSYRQRPTYRLTYRNFTNHEALFTNQSVEAAPNVAGARWYELRRANPDGSNVNPAGGADYSIFQQGTYAPADGIHRWMGSIAQDKNGNAALGYSVVNGINVFPGIRYTGRLAGDPPGLMTQGEGTIINGDGVQTTTNSRWGDYTSMNVDPTDDCTFWYVNEYYTAAGQATSTAGWQTRIASFALPGC
jgi:hypothetical protein